MVGLQAATQLLGNFTAGGMTQCIGLMSTARITPQEFRRCYSDYTTPGFRTH
jgi:hypothetical protein